MIGKKSGKTGDESSSLGMSRQWLFLLHVQATDGSTGVWGAWGTRMSRGETDQGPWNGSLGSVPTDSLLAFNLTNVH